MNKTISLFASSSDGNLPVFRRDAEKLGILIGEKGWNLICGDGGGLADIVAKAAQKNGSKVTNIVTLSNIHRNTVGRAYQVKDVYEQQEALNSVGDAYITLPGSGMTLAEFFSSLVHNYRTKSNKMIALLNTNNFFGNLLKFFETISNLGFSQSSRPDQVVIRNNPESIISTLDALLKKTP